MIHSKNHVNHVNLVKRTNISHSEEIGEECRSGVSITILPLRGKSVAQERDRFTTDVTRQGGYVRFHCGTFRSEILTKGFSHTSIGWYQYRWVRSSTNVVARYTDVVYRDDMKCDVWDMKSLCVKTFRVRFRVLCGNIYVVYLTIRVSGFMIG